MPDFRTIATLCQIDNPEWFDPQKIFLDVGGSIPIGVDFRGYLDHQISSNRLVVFLIGSNWAGNGTSGGSRIFHRRDFVRIEIESALHRGKPFVVVLMDRELPPSRAELPESIQAICDPAPIVVSSVSFDDDLGRLKTHLKGKLKALRPSLFQWWTQMSEEDRDSPIAPRLMKYCGGILCSIAFIVVIYTAPWTDYSWWDHLCAGAVAMLFGLPALIGLGKVIGCFLEWRSRSKRQER